MVSVIPNAVVADNFRPLGQNTLDSRRTSAPGPPQPLGPTDMITIVVISRLFYNKGIDLLIAIIPRILSNQPNVRFLVAGSGPKAIDFEQMVERNVLQDRVSLLGPVRHDEVRDVMVQGHIYLNPSLMEAFGTVIVEAASCGLYIVCTRVGGVPEVLPSHMTEFAAPEEDDLVAATNRAIAKLRSGKVRTDLFHNQVKQMYSWTDVAQRTERVYDGISTTRSFALIDRLKRYYGCGTWAGKLFCMCAVVDYLLFIFLEIFAPRERIDICKNWPRKMLKDNMESGVQSSKDSGGVARKKSTRHRRKETRDG
jgi:phosphatidylinositol glycan class A protein